MLIFYFQFIAVHITAPCGLEQTSTVLTTANRPDSTIPSSVPFSCWRAHTALPLLSLQAQLNWRSLYHRLVLQIHKHISDDLIFMLSSWLLHIGFMNLGFMYKDIQAKLGIQKRWLHCSGTWMMLRLLQRHQLYTYGILALWGEMYSVTIFDNHYTLTWWK